MIKFAGKKLESSIRRRQARGRCIAEALEGRIFLDSVSFDSSTPQVIPIGVTNPGQNVGLVVNFQTNDPGDQSENEPLVITSSSGFVDTIYAYGEQNVVIPITQLDQTVSAYINGADGDELATITTLPTAAIAINNTSYTTDNVTLFNPPGSALPYTQTIPALIVNTSDSEETLGVAVLQYGSGNVSLSQSTVTLGGGASTNITVTPTADSSSVSDVDIIVTADGMTLAQDYMTVIGVTFPVDIYNQDTPAAMLNSFEYRIPNRTTTPITVNVTPSNISAVSTSVDLTVTGQGAGPGTVLIDGTQMENLSGSKSVGLSGGTQTLPMNGGQLQLTLQVRGDNTIQSSGFSVVAIPQNVSFVDSGSLTSLPASFFNQPGNGQIPVVGFKVHYSIQSDSGNTADMDMVLVSEQVQVMSSTGVFGNNVTEINSSYLTFDQTVDPGTFDYHSTSVGAINRRPRSGTQVTDQVFTFELLRLDPTLEITIANSGFVLNRKAFADPTNTGLIDVTVTKMGAAVTAKGFSSKAGTGTAMSNQTINISTGRVSGSVRRAAPATKILATSDALASSTADDSTAFQLLESGGDALNLRTPSDALGGGR